MSDRGKSLLDDELAALLDGEPAERPADFDDGLYLRLNQDVAAAVVSGVYASGFEHYMKYGAKEGRRYRPALGEPVGPVVVSLDLPPPSSGRPVGGARPVPAMPAHSIEALRVSGGGGVFIVGWIDDALDTLTELRLEGDGWALDVARLSLARVRRRDVEAVLKSNQRHAYGYWSFIELGRDMPRQTMCRVRLRTRSGAYVMLDVEGKSVGDQDLRDVVLGYLADSDFFGNPHTCAVACLDGGVADQIVAHNRRITAAMVANPYVERFGPTGRPAKGSLVVCLYGKPEYLFLQNALFAGGAGIEDYELVYVCNSPELGERLLKDARIASAVHGMRQTLVLLPGNAGFGAANNLAVNYASSDRVVALNPDVFPWHTDWARRHTAAVENLPPAETSLFGVPLYYDDGSLMHGGMFFDIDTALVAEPGGMTSRELVRVEHYGKGAPPDTARFVQPRRVPAVTGAFMSCRRDWFERLGGFTEDFVFGHYEDADLCLRSLAAGAPVWLHDIRLWHLEGKGSIRLPVHEGGSFVNRWLFSRRWASEIRNGLLGPSPTHPLLSEPSRDEPPLPAEQVAPVAAEAAAAVPHLTSGLELARPMDLAEPIAMKRRADAKPPATRREARRSREEPRAASEGGAQS
jgi:GT2 family glycosyltransferase